MSSLDLVFWWVGAAIVSASVFATVVTLVGFLVVAPADYAFRRLKAGIQFMRWYAEKDRFREYLKSRDGSLRRIES